MFPGDKHNAFVMAQFLCNFSCIASFPFVITGNWLAKRVVLMLERCEETKTLRLDINSGLRF